MGIRTSASHKGVRQGGQLGALIAISRGSMPALAVNADRGRSRPQGLIRPRSRTPVRHEAEIPITVGASSTIEKQSQGAKRM